MHSPAPDPVQAPHGRVGLFTGASHRDSMSASALHAVVETPAESGRVM